ncbi:hypothetical protein Taro_036424 [Colocasia esculenta]|uniref:Uncharacterized protein n=1 Tax=Colocasia esculenta TaxID=4460 RepID=A0A843WLM3_COLES|nr:hypothetical protein [Colocasia esculenta]
MPKWMQPNRPLISVYQAPFSFLELWRTKEEAEDEESKEGGDLEQEELGNSVSQVTTLHTTTELDWSDEHSEVIAMECP